MLTFLNIRENLQLLLTMQGLSYIADTRKELNAITKFTMEGFTPDYAFGLIAKIIAIKQHPNYKKDFFWIGCAVNLSDAYSYRVKIETVYPTLPIEQPHTKVPFPTKRIREGDTSEYSTINENSGVRSNTEDVELGAWKHFIEWSKSHLTRSSVEILLSIEIEIDGRSITIRHDLSEFLRQIVIKFFHEEIKPPILIAFEKPKT
jgi:hypothetical protein